MPLDAQRDVLMWKPSTSGTARRYAIGKWDAVVSEQPEWPPAAMAHVARRPRRTA